MEASAAQAHVSWSGEELPRIAFTLQSPLSPSECARYVQERAPLLGDPRLLPDDITRLGDALELHYAGSHVLGASRVRVQLIPTASGTTLRVEEPSRRDVSPPSTDPRPLLVVLASVTLLKFFWDLPVPWLLGAGGLVGVVALLVLREDDAVPERPATERAADLLQRTLAATLESSDNPRLERPS